MPAVLRSFLRLAVACGLVVLLVLASAGRAGAEAPSPRANPVHVLGIDSDDAEDQADALTGALRSRVRGAPGLSLQETQHSLGMLTAALRCPTRPDAVCLLKIGDQLHADRFVWGTVVKSAGSQVTAEVHLWTRGKPDSSTKETYSDNLKDQNDETLRRIATRILERISGALSNGSITVHAGDAEGTVWIDGQRKATLDRGTARVELPPGSYAVEVRAKGFQSALEEKVTVNGGQDTSVPVKLTPEAPPAAAASTSKGGDTARRVAEFGLLGVGALAEIVAGVEGVRFLSAKNDLDAQRAQIGRGVSDVCATSGIPFTEQTAAASACSKFNDAKDARTITIIVGAAGLPFIVAGVVMLATDHPHKEGSADGAPTASLNRPTLRVLPYAAPRAAGVDLTLTF